MIDESLMCVTSTNFPKREMSDTALKGTLKGCHNILHKPQNTWPTDHSWKELCECQWAKQWQIHWLAKHQLAFPRLTFIMLAFFLSFRFFSFSCASSAFASFHERTAEIQKSGERASRRYQQNSHGFLAAYTTNWCNHPPSVSSTGVFMGFSFSILYRPFVVEMELSEWVWCFERFVACWAPSWLEGKEGQHTVPAVKEHIRCNCSGVLKGDTNISLAAKRSTVGQTTTFTED